MSYNYLSSSNRADDPQKEARESRFQRHAALRNLSFSPAVSKPLIIGITGVLF